MGHFDPNDPSIKREIVHLILQYLQDEGYTASFLTMQDESNVKLAEQQTQRSLFKRMRKAILEGDWPEFDKLCGKMSFQQQKSFQYSAYREQFIELIEAHEYQKAFTHLTKRLKPLERSAASAGDFKNLCYLLTCRSVHEVLPHWQGVSAAREALLAQFATMMDLEERQQEGEVVLPASRLVTLLEQAAAYQVSHSATAFGGALATAAAPTDTAPTVSVPDAAGAVIYGIGACGTAPLAVGSAGSAEPASTGGRIGTTGGIGDLGDLGSAAARMPSKAPSWAPPKSSRPPPGQQTVTSLLADYAAPCLPNAVHRTLRGHAAGLKTVAWLGRTGLLVSGGNDPAVCLWETRTGTCISRLEGHAARVWQLAVGRTDGHVASASADGTIKLWRCIEAAEAEAAAADDGVATVDFAGARSGAPEDPSGGVGGVGIGVVVEDPPPAFGPVGTLTGHQGDVYSVF